MAFSLLVPSLLALAPRAPLHTGATSRAIVLTHIRAHVVASAKSGEPNLARRDALAMAAAFTLALPAVCAHGTEEAPMT
eukprot:6213366-Pleurochrysis_carterae.AAC.3